MASTLGQKRVLPFEGANRGDALERLAEERIDGRFGDRLEPLHLTRRLKVEALAGDEQEEEDGDEDEDERRDDGDGDAGGDDEEEDPQNSIQLIRNFVVCHLDVLGESIPESDGE